jgi:glutathione peroxidase-family protein
MTIQSNPIQSNYILILILFLFIHYFSNKTDDIRDRVLLIVNVACNCGFTGGNYPQLQEMFQKYEPKGLSVLAFPCNQFGGQVRKIYLKKK